MTDRFSRRRVLASIGLGAIPFAGCGRSRGAWVPTDAGLSDVVASRQGAYAVGEAGVILHRGENEWSVAVENGPADAGNGLRSADVTNNGRTVWFCGDSGAVGLYDTVADHLADFSAPREKTSSWEAVAVSGLSGNERISLLNGSGELLLVAQLDAPLNAADRFVLILPSRIASHPGFYEAIGTVKSIAAQLGIPLLCLVIGADAERYKQLIDSVAPETTFDVETVPGGDQFESALDEQVDADDYVMAMSPRENTRGWKPRLRQVPNQLTDLDVTNVSMVYPAEEDVSDKRRFLRME